MSLHTLRKALAVVGSAGALMISAAPAATADPASHERFHDFGSEPFTDCGLTLVHSWDVWVNAHVVTRGDGLVYFMDNVNGHESFTNTTTHRSYQHDFHSSVRDQQITDNGDGTLTIISLGAGGETWSADDGTVLHDDGTIRFGAVIDDGGTPGDPSDDQFLEDLGIVKPSTGTNDTDGRDFCEDLVLFTS